MKRDALLHGEPCVVDSETAEIAVGKKSVEAAYKHNRRKVRPLIWEGREVGWLTIEESDDRGIEPGELIVFVSYKEARANIVKEATKLSIKYAISYDEALRRLKYIEAFIDRAEKVEAENKKLKLDLSLVQEGVKDTQAIIDANNDLQREIAALRNEIVHLHPQLGKATSIVYKEKSEYQQGDVRGIPIRDGKTGTRIDLSDAEIFALIQWPGELLEKRKLSFITDGTDGLVMIVLDHAGPWVIQFKIVKSGVATWHTDVEHFNVKPKEK